MRVKRIRRIIFGWFEYLILGYFGDILNVKRMIVVIGGSPVLSYNPE